MEEHVEKKRKLQHEDTDMYGITIDALIKQNDWKKLKEYCTSTFDNFLHAQRALLTALSTSERKKLALEEENKKLQDKIENLVETRIKEMSKAIDYNQKKDAELERFRMGPYNTEVMIDSKLDFVRIDIDEIKKENDNLKEELKKIKLEVESSAIAKLKYDLNPEKSVKKNRLPIIGYIKKLEERIRTLETKNDVAIPSTSNELVIDLENHGTTDSESFN